MDENYGMLKKGLIILAIPFVLQLVFLTILLKSQIDNTKAQDLTIHTKDVIAETEALSRKLVMLRNNLLGLAMSGDAQVNPFDSLVGEVDQHLAKLHDLVNDNRPQQQKIEKTEPAVREYVAWVGQTYSLLRGDRRDEAIARIKTQQGKRMLDVIQADIKNFRDEEERLEIDRREIATQSGRWLVRAIVLGTIFTMALAAAMVVIYSRGFGRRIEALVENAKRLAEGKALIAPIKGKDELAQLAMAFDNMARTLDERDRENEMFIYSVSHDLRSPLVNLQGFSRELSLASDDLKGILATLQLSADESRKLGRILDGDVRDAIHFIQTAVTRLSAIIDSLLRLSRAGRVEYRMEALDMNALAGRVVESERATIDDKGATLVINNLPPAWGDPTAIEQVLSNLLTNALKYLDPARPGRIEVGAERSGGDGPPSITYHVRDNGLGIPEAHQAKLFVAFQRLHPGVAHGEGVGLALVRRMVERHSGKIWAKSEPGVGSTFFVTLPAAPERAAETISGTTPEPRERA